MQKYPAKNRNNGPPLKSKSILNQINKTLYKVLILNIGKGTKHEYKNWKDDISGES